MIALCTSAQEVSETIKIKSETFRAAFNAQNDALANVNIDAIGLDTSRKPCARIKILCEKMTKAQIAELEVVFRSNTYLAKQKVGDYENLLILEMTAKPNTRFYLRHPIFGDSNEVTFNLDEYTEYLLEAELNKQFSFTVFSNQAGADIYINNDYRGKTKSDKACTIPNLFQGQYSLRVEFGNNKTEQKVIVGEGENNYAIVNIDHKATVYKYLVINTNPKSALVEIDGKSIARNGDGKIQQRLPEGLHSYCVSADNYHAKRDTISLSGSSTRTINISLDPAFGYLNIPENNSLKGANVYVDNSQRGTIPLSKPIPVKSGTHSVRIIKDLYLDYNGSVTITDGNTSTLQASLTPNFAPVTITIANNAEIWVNGEKKGSGKWSGNLELGKHTIDLRHTSYEETHHQLEITSTASISKDYGALTPIYGTLDINCNISDAKIYLNDIEIGVTPTIKNDVLIGDYTLKITKSGYKPHIQKVKITKGETTLVNPTLTTYSASKSSSSSSSTYNSSSYSSPQQSKSSTTSTTKKSSSNSKHMLQFGVGIEYAGGSKCNLINVPVEFRIGRCNQTLNGSIIAKFGHISYQHNKNDLYNPELKAQQYSAGAKLRYNTPKNFFVDLGGYYNFNVKAEYKTGAVGYDTTEIESYKKYTINDIINPQSISVLAGVGYGFDLLDLSLFATYDVTPTFVSDNLASHLVANNGGRLMLSDFDNAQKMAKNRFFIGLSCKIYFGSGFFK